MNKPTQLDVVDLTKLRICCQDYIDFVSSDKYHCDNDFDYYIFEEALIAIFGDDVFDFTNSKTS